MTSTTLNLDPLKTQILEAFTAALAQLNSDLPDEVRQEINNALIERLNQELDPIEREATEGLNIARSILDNFPGNFAVIQLFAFLNTSIFFVETSRRRIQTRVDYLSATEVITDDKIQEVGEDLAIELGQVLETKIAVTRIKNRLENLQ